MLIEDMLHVNNDDSYTLRKIFLFCKLYEMRFPKIHHDKFVPSTDESILGYKRWLLSYRNRERAKRLRIQFQLKILIQNKSQFVCTLVSFFVSLLFVMISLIKSEKDY